MKKDFQDKMERVNIDEALKNTKKTFKEQLQLFIHQYTQIGLWTSSLLLILWATFTKYNKTALTAIPLVTLALLEDYLWNQN